MAGHPNSSGADAASAVERVWLDEVAGILAASPGVVGARVLGSSARGEAAGLWWEGRWQRLSDLELLVICRSRLGPAAQRRIRERVDVASATWGQSSPLFHLDLVFRERRRLSSLPPFVFTYEAREAGRTLLGPELGPAIREVTLANLDRRNTHEILVKRLWHLAEALPAGLGAMPAPSPFLAAGLRVGIERQALDLPTALLPDAGRLIAGFQARLRSWERQPPDAAATIEAWLGRAFVPYLSEVLAARGGLALGRGPWTEAYAPALAVLAGGLDHLCSPQIPEQEARDPAGGRVRPRAQLPDLAAALAALAEALPQVSTRLFNERPVTPGEAWATWQQAVRIANSRGAREGLRWLRRPRKGLLAAGLLQLHAAGLAIVEGRMEAAPPALLSARRCLAAVHADAPSPEPRPAEALAASHGVGGRTDDPAAVLETWRAVRREAGRAFWRVARLGSPTAWAGLEARLLGPCA